MSLRTMREIAFWRIMGQECKELTSLSTTVHLLFRRSKATATGALVSGSCRILPASALGSEAISSRTEPSLALSFASLAVSEPTEVCKISQRLLHYKFDDVKCACSAVSDPSKPSLALSFASLAVSEPTEVCKFIRVHYIRF